MANGISYCLVFLIAMDTDGAKTKTTFSIRYNDEYVKKSGRWYIAKRISNFEIRETVKIN